MVNGGTGTCVSSSDDSVIGVIKLSTYSTNLLTLLVIAAGTDQQYALQQQSSAATDEQTKAFQQTVATAQDVRDKIATPRNDEPRARRGPPT